MQVICIVCVDVAELLTRSDSPNDGDGIENDRCMCNSVSIAALSRVYILYRSQNIPVTVPPQPRICEVRLILY